MLKHTNGTTRLNSARIAAILHPIGAPFPALLGPSGIAAFVVLHGAGNGTIMIANGTLVLALFGPRGYGCVTASWRVDPHGGIACAAPVRPVDRPDGPACGRGVGRALSLRIRLAMVAAAAPGVGGRAGSERLTITEEVEPMRTPLFLVFALLLAMLPIPAFAQSQPASTVRTLLTAGRLASVVDMPLYFSPSSSSALLIEPDGFRTPTIVVVMHHDSEVERGRIIPAAAKIALLPPLPSGSA
jgi:hypothetical protein